MSLFVVFIALIAWVFGEASGYGGSFVGIALIISGLVSFTSYWWSDKAVLAMTGAQPADRTIHFDFYTTAENMAIAAGLPKPKLYVINDPAPNAFATGRDPEHAVVVATTGILERLDRTELEGVISHELSHVKNFDIRLMAIVTVLVGMVAFVADLFMRNLWWGGRRNNDRSSSSGIFLIVGIILAILSPIIATLIKLAVSRKREYLADATGANLTRNPGALADALEKIAADPHVLRTASSSTAHLFIENPFKKKNSGQMFASLFNTHPPVEERVRILRAM
ncbi:MAG: M48 family metallopeptidase [Candidatus Roizmanbacteria bacterium]|nr:M48 family metallopeptidase [Candidatus Roizmanbacteria bacterium]